MTECHSEGNRGPLTASFPTMPTFISDHVAARGGCNSIIAILEAWLCHECALILFQTWRGIGQCLAKASSVTLFAQGGDSHARCKITIHYLNCMKYIGNAFYSEPCRQRGFAHAEVSFCGSFNVSPPMWVRCRHEPFRMSRVLHRRRRWRSAVRMHFPW